MARNRQRTRDNVQQNFHDMENGIGTVSRNMCDMLRTKAASMGHAAANFPDSVWNKYMNMQDKRQTLTEAKLYIENYMMGNLNPQEFARVMAEDDNLRYTISDICRIRLEPVNLDLPEHDGSHVDLGAGVKTFWTEIHVPLPSELDAARDIRNINFGIEAGRATAGVESVRRTDSTDEQDAPKKKRRSFGELLNDAKRRAAEAVIEKLTPIAEGRKDEAPELDESFFDTEEGQVYKSEVTRMAAQQIENTAMNIEAAKSGELSPEDQRRALEAAGMRYDGDEEFVTDDQTFERLYWPDIKEVSDINDQDFAKLTWAIDRSETEKFMSQFTEFENRYNEINNFLETPEKLPDESDAQYMQRVNQMWALEQKPDESDVMFQIRQEAWNEYRVVKTVMDVMDSDEPIITDADLVSAAKLQFYSDILEYKEAQKVIDRYNENTANMQSSPKPIQQEQETESLRSGFSREELNQAANPQMKELFDQIANHVNQDRTNGQRRNNQQQDSNQQDNTRQTNDQQQDNSQKDNRQRKGRIYGEFDGKPVSFKNNWSGHEFTQEEADKLLAGETISVEYVKDGKTKTVSGKLEWQTYNDRQYLGFKADYDKNNERSDDVKQEPVKNEPAEDNSLFSEEDLRAANGVEESYVQDEFTSEEIAQFNEQLAADMEAYQSEYGFESGTFPEIYDDPNYSEEPELSAEDLNNLFNSDNAMNR